MRRRPSASNTDDDDDKPNEADAPAPSALPKAPLTRSNSNQYLDPNPNSKKTRIKNSRLADSNWRNSRIQSSLDAKSHLHLPLADQESDLPDPQSDTMVKKMRFRNPWLSSWLALGTLVTSFVLLLGLYRSFTLRQLDPKGGSMSYMASSFVRYSDFDTEHTHFATKYSLHLYRELGVDEDPRVKGVPVLFIPGNAGSYKQVRSLASEAEHYFDEVIKSDSDAIDAGKRALDFFTVDFNEDFTAFHGQTLLDQAEYLNDAIAYILSLYHNPDKSRKDSSLPDPSSVILIGHSMGGIVARTMLTMANYQSNSVNTIITLSAPHARPPLSFDSQMVRTYKSINDYWRRSHSKEWGMDNPLWHVTLISIAGGGLDTIVPSDYSSISSLVPETHGFTVFTSTIPNVWTGMDHLAITWCDEFRKTVIKSLFDVLDVNRPAQTKPRGERMRIFKLWFLTGLEDVTEKTLPHKEPKTLLTLEENADSVLSQGERLVIRALGHESHSKAYFLPVPPQGSLEGRKFTLLTSAHIDRNGHSNQLEVLFCSVYPLHAGHYASLFTMNLDLTGDGHGSGSTRLACKNGAVDTITLPASTPHSKYAFDKISPFSYIQYDLETIAEHQFVAIVDKADVPSDDFLIAEFSANSEAQISSSTNIKQFIWSPLHWKFQVDRPLVMDIKIPALESSLLAYHLTVSPSDCGSDTLFRPLVRQYISDVYESKFFVNVAEADINVHGVAPYMPPSMRSKDTQHGLAFQIWSDPTCAAPMHVSLAVDILGSFGKLWMRYRTLFATFPLVIVALVLAKQFKIYDETGVFISFTEGLNICLRREIPVLLGGLVFVLMIVSNSFGAESPTSFPWFDRHHGNATESMSDYAMNNLLTGSPDPFFWFLLPVFGVICTGLCIAINYMLLFVTYIFTFVLTQLLRAPKADDARRQATVPFAITSTKQRIITTSVLLALVATVLPYQFAYLVLCIVQVVTTVRAWRLVRDNRNDAMYSFYNYSHSLLVLMIWILPINLPVLVVWVRNLAVQWLTPFSSHHNILSIVPFILLVETSATGKMVPRLYSRFRYCTSTWLLTLALFAAVYGVSYAYALHQVANLFCAWLVLVLWYTGSWELEKVIDDVVSGHDEKSKKRP